MKPLLVLTALALAACHPHKKDEPEVSAAYQGMHRQVAEREVDGGVVVVEIDVNEDGNADIFNYYRPRENAERLLVKKEADMNGDGKVDIITEFSDLGELVTESMDRNFDGRMDWRDHYQDGQRVMSETDDDFDGNMDVFSYFREKKITRKERDTDGDGRIDLWERYNEEGEVIKTGADTNGDGKMDFREE